MYCKKCGNELKDGSAFCTRCGAKVDGAQDTEAVKAAEAMSNAVPVQGSQQMVKTTGKLSKKAMAIAFACVAAVAALVVYGVNKNEKVQETAAEAVDMEKHLAQPLYNIEGPGHISLKENVASPGSKEDGMTWDETLFYWLEDVDTTSSEDGNIASCLIYKTQLINDDNGNLIQYEIYKDSETKEVYKIVSIEQQTDGLLITDYYYDKGKINFIFERKESIYTPTYATTDKTGNRYYFNNDTMVRWRMINEPRVLEEYTLAMREVSYTQWHYFAEPADVQKKYDEKEQEMLNAAYNTYAAVADAVGIGTVEGNVTDTTNTALEGITVSVIRQTDDVLLYQTKTAEDGSFRIYVNLDETECYMELVGTEEYKALTINDVTLGISDLVKSYNNLIMHKTGGDEYPVEVCVYSAENVVTKEEESTKGDKLLGATVTVREGAMNYDGDILTTAQADASGIIILNLKSGIYTLQIDIEGYETAYLEIEVNEQETKKDAYMIPSVASGKTAVLLTWKDAETDLDLTLYTPYQAEGGDMAHIGAGTMEDAYGNRLISDNSTGCELMYLDSTALGNYKIYVNNYTDSLAGNYTSNALAVLEVHIYIYNENGLVTEYTFPAGQNGVVWEVAEISGSQVSSANRVYSSVEQGSIWSRRKAGGSVHKTVIAEYLQNEDYEGALSYYEQVKAVAPLDENLYLYAADIYLIQNKYEEAVKLLNEGIDVTGSELLENRKSYIGDSLKEVRSENANVGGISETEYATNGNEIKWISYYGNGSIDMYWEYEYDTKGNQTKWIWYDEEGKYESEYKYEYDIDGNKTKEIRYDTDGNVDWWTEYEYATNGKQIKEIRYGEDGNITNLRERDVNGNIIKEYEWGNWYEYKCEYDANGNVIKYIANNDDGSIRYWVESEYDVNGNEIKSIRYNTEGDMELWCEYDANGNEIKYIAYNDDGSVRYWVESEYDDMGNEIKSNTEGYGIIHTDIEYDDNGNIISSESYREDGSSWGETRYLYDNTGNVIWEHQSGYDSHNMDNGYSYAYFGDILCMLNITSTSGKVTWNNINSPFRYRIIPDKTSAPLKIDEMNKKALKQKEYTVIGEIGDFYQLENGWYVEKDQKNITYSISK